MPGAERAPNAFVGWIGYWQEGWVHARDARRLRHTATRCRERTVFVSMCGVATVGLAPRWLPCIVALTLAGFSHAVAHERAWPVWLVLVASQVWRTRTFLVYAALLLRKSKSS